MNNIEHLHHLDTQIKLAFRKGMITEYKFLIKDKQFPTLYESVNQIVPEIRVIELRISNQYESKIAPLVDHLKHKYNQFQISTLFNRITMILI